MPSPGQSASCSFLVGHSVVLMIPRDYLLITLTVPRCGTRDIQDLTSSFCLGLSLLLSVQHEDEDDDDDKIIKMEKENLAVLLPSILILKILRAALLH